MTAEPADSADDVVEAVDVGEKRVGASELFFDLVFVFAVTQLSTLISEDHGWEGLARALIVFVPVYWTWVGTAIQANTRDMSTAGSQLALFSVALFGFGMALNIDAVYSTEGRALEFALCYWAARCCLGARMFLPSWQWGVQLNPITVSMFFTGPMLVIGAVIGGDAQVWVWLLAAVVDLSTPTVFKSRLRDMHFDAAHLVERFGCLVLIALGESIVAIGIPAAHVEHESAEVIAAVVAAFVVTSALWWVYFFYASDAMRHALSTAQVQMHVARHVLSYGHVLFIASIITVAAGMHAAIAHPGESLELGIVGLLFGGCAVYLSAFSYTRWMMFRKISTTRLVAAGLVVLLIPLGAIVSALAALVLLAAVLVGLNLVEYQIVQHRLASEPTS